MAYLREVAAPVKLVSGSSRDSTARQLLHVLQVESSNLSDHYIPADESLPSGPSASTRCSGEDDVFFDSAASSAALLALFCKS